MNKPGFPREVVEWFREQGRRGGKVGGRPRKDGKPRGATKPKRKAKR